MWVTSDSRISRAEGEPLIEDGAKLFGLPVVCRGVGEDKFFSDIYFAHSFGYCFAGSTLMGQNAYLAIAPLLTTLISTERYIPSMDDVATFVFKFLCRTFDAFKVRVAAGALFEASLFGWCHVRRSLQIWHFHPNDSSGTWEMTRSNVRQLQRSRRALALRCYGRGQRLTKGTAPCCPAANRRQFLSLDRRRRAASNSK